MGYEDAPLGMQAIKAAGFLKASLCCSACAALTELCRVLYIAAVGATVNCKVLLVLLLAVPLPVHQPCWRLTVGRCPCRCPCPAGCGRDPNAGLPQAGGMSCSCRFDLVPATAACATEAGGHLHWPAIPCRPQPCRPPPTDAAAAAARSRCSFTSCFQPSATPFDPTHGPWRQ